MKTKIDTIEFQRNGVMGEPFYAVWFTYEKQKLIAVVTQEAGGCHVIDPLKPENHFRGDHFEKDIRYAIQYWCSLKYGITLDQARIELNDGLQKAVY